MSQISKIEWTDSTWNPVRGCSLVSEGCKNCYAMHFAHRFSGEGKSYEGLTKRTNSGVKWTGEARLIHSELTKPMKWKTPRRIFVCSMSDLFHEDLTFSEINQVFLHMAQAPQHIYQILTKRPERARQYFDWVHPDYRAVPNWWIGTSVENQKTANERIPDLLNIRCGVRFLSCEPLIGPVNLEMVPDYDPKSPAFNLDLIDWVIAGGESGHHARPMHPEWVRSLRDQCEEHEIPFFFKQWGEWVPPCEVNPDGLDMPAHTKSIEVGYAYTANTVINAGKKAAGNMLDGKQHLEFPIVSY